MRIAIPEKDLVKKWGSVVGACFTTHRTFFNTIDPLQPFKQLVEEPNSLGLEMCQGERGSP
ncbi:hypothetical protein [Mesorhizobium sp. M0643]|uniref:hypothetical protein n=1 Tax=Mesorhizobium sp. M0643 TaxID=2956978 RepID=UPI003339C518